MDEGKVKFHYIKSNAFRVVHADGAIGGLTPQLNVFVSLYSDRLPIPELQVMQVDENGLLGSELANERVSKPGVVREVEVGVVLSLSTARALAQFLTEQVQQADEFAKTKVESK